MPVYGPSSEEPSEITEEEGSFSISEMNVHGATTDTNRDVMTPSRFMNGTRAVFEPFSRNFLVFWCFVFASENEVAVFALFLFLPLKKY